jgi:hypothetical protein
MGEFSTPKPHALTETERRRAILGFVRRSRSYRGDFSDIAPSFVRKCSFGVAKPLTRSTILGD